MGYAVAIAAFLAFIAVVVIAAILILVAIYGRKVGIPLNIVNVTDAGTAGSNNGGYIMYIVSSTKDNINLNIPANNNNVKGVIMYVANASATATCTLVTTSLAGYSFIDQSSTTPTVVAAGTLAQFVFTNTNVLLRVL